MNDDEVPTDVRDTLGQLLSEAHDAVGERPETARDAIDTVDRVATNKLPEGDRQDRLEHGCRAAADALDAGDDALAREYLRAMTRRLGEGTD
ncbi:hypothetical protein BRD17_08245 [Halobacteriales archaeon SW_7_68_16]|nr:MAG: hypothetical protein BRD17_08245 [Halobacteriales archaeon SW_7_68_16]